MKRLSSWLAPLFLSAILVPAARAADIDGLLPFLPLPTNAVVVVRVAEILQTDRATQEDWRNKPGELLAGAVRIPSWVDTLVQATRFNPLGGRPAWSAAVAPVPPRVSIELMARHEKAPLQDLAGHKAFRSSRGYAVELKPGLVGVLRTGSRQDAALWVVQSDRGVGGISAYLSDAARSPGHMILAFDATNMVDPQGVRFQLSQSGVLEGKPVELDGAVRLLPGLRGVRTTINVGAPTTAEIRLDFSAPVGGLAPTIKALFVEFLNDHGAAIEEFSQAEASADGNAVVLRSSLSDESLRKLASLISAPTPDSPSAAATPGPGPGPGTPAPPMPPPGAPPAPGTSQGGTSEGGTSAGPNVEATQSYFKEVTRLARDLQSLMRNPESYDKSATWHENFARRIDDLPVLGVDPQAVAFGNNTSMHFRALAASLRGEPVKLTALNQSISYDLQIHTDYPTGYKYGMFGYVPGPGELQSNAAKVRSAQAATVAKSSADRDQIWGAITNQQNQTRAALSQKYNVEF